MEHEEKKNPIDEGAMREIAQKLAVQALREVLVDAAVEKATERIVELERANAELAEARKRDDRFGTYPSALRVLVRRFGTPVEGTNARFVLVPFDDVDRARDAWVEIVSLQDAYQITVSTTSAKEAQKP